MRRLVLLLGLLCASSHALLQKPDRTRKSKHVTVANRAPSAADKKMDAGDKKKQHQVRQRRKKRGAHVTLKKNAQRSAATSALGIEGEKESDGGGDARQLNYDAYHGEGWCGGGVDEYVNGADDAWECWDKCEDLLGGALVAIDFWEDYFQSCYCQDACDCMENTWFNDDDMTLLISNDEGDLPDACSYSYEWDDDWWYGWDDDDDDDDDGGVSAGTLFCSSHDECPPGDPFCYDGECADCDECHFCSDGV